MSLREGLVRIATENAGKALDFLRTRKRNYNLAFNTLAGQYVLMDLAKFCRATETCFHVDARKHAVAEGRREVWLRIQQHLNLSAQDLYTLYAGQNIQSRLISQETDDD